MQENKISLTEETCQKEELIYKNNRELFYYYDKEKKCYARKVAYQYENNQLIIKQGWDALETRLEEIIKKINAGELSILAYYMERSQMDVTMLSQYSGIRRWKVKKHLVPKGFRKISNKSIEKYANALDISIQQLTSPEFSAKICILGGKETNG